MNIILILYQLLPEDYIKGSYCNTKTTFVKNSYAHLQTSETPALSCKFYNLQSAVGAVIHSCHMYQSEIVKNQSFKTAVILSKMILFSSKTTRSRLQFDCYVCAKFESNAVKLLNVKKRSFNMLLPSMHLCFLKTYLFII